MISILFFIVVLSAVVIVHEFGHLITAKMFNVYCFEFSIGFGPKIISKKGKETEFSIRAIPLGGYVRMAGEESLEGDVEVEKERQLTGIHPLKRIIVFLAGIFNNIIFGIVIYSIIYLMLGYYVQYPEPIIDSITPGYPAEEIGLQANDRIYSMTFENGLTIKPRTFNDVSAYMNSFAGKIDLVIIRNNEKLSYEITPIEKDGSYYMGVTMPEIKVIDVNVSNCLVYGFKGALNTVYQVIDTLQNLVRGKGFDNLSGPIGIYSVTDELVQQSQNSFELIYYLLQITGLLTINIGLFNLLPIPMFDGGKVVLCFIEMIIGKPIDKKIEGYLLYGSLILVLLIFVFSMFNDVTKYIL